MGTTTSELATTDTLSGDKLALLKRTLCAGATNDEFELFVHACKRTGLDPFMRQIHAVFRNDRNRGRVMNIQTGIDGYRLIADRSGRYAGNDDAQFAQAADQPHPHAARVTVYKMVEGQRCPFTATARWTEYYPGDGAPGFMWRKMPHVMLGKVAEALALRKAFPAELSGVYTREEMEQAGPEIAEPADDARSGKPAVSESAPTRAPQPGISSKGAPPPREVVNEETGEVIPDEPHDAAEPEGVTDAQMTEIRTLLEGMPKPIASKLAKAACEQNHVQKLGLLTEAAAGKFIGHLKSLAAGVKETAAA